MNQANRTTYILAYLLPPLLAVPGGLLGWPLITSNVSRGAEIAAAAAVFAALMAAALLFRHRYPQVAERFGQVQPTNTALALIALVAVALLACAATLVLRR